MTPKVEPCFISIISETNSPIITYCPPRYRTEMEHILKSNVLANISLDYFESNLYKWKQTSDGDVTIKNLFQIEEVSVFGMLVLSTNLKIVIGFPVDNSFDDIEIKRIFDGIRKVYTRVKCNPFITVNIENQEEEVSRLLEEKLNEIFT